MYIATTKEILLPLYRPRKLVLLPTEKISISITRNIREGKVNCESFTHKNPPEKDGDRDGLHIGREGLRLKIVLLVIGESAGKRQ